MTTTICDELKNIGLNLASAGFYNLEVFIDDLRKSFLESNYDLKNKYRRVALDCLNTARKFIRENLD